MNRCLELAKNGSGFTAPNPMVGAVLVYENRIIGEGYHHRFGESHAEVNAINDAIKKGDENLLSKSVLYVSLEPCSHFGKTPPCADLIIKNKIPHVIIGCQDPFPGVNGRGIKKLIEAGVKVETGVLENECKNLNSRFFTYHLKKRPYVVLKFAQSADNFLSPNSDKNKKVSNEVTDILVHKWRSEESSIMVGTRTAEMDNPSLTVRKWKGKNPIRIVIDRRLRLPKDLNLFDGSAQTIVFNESLDRVQNNTEYVSFNFNEDVPGKILSLLYDRKILSVMIEGGAILLKQFIDQNLWDEARRITATELLFEDGTRAPELNGNLISSEKIKNDLVEVLFAVNSAQ